MQVFFHKHFEKKFIKLHDKIKDKFDLSLDLFGRDPYNEKLNNHELHGKYADHRSINVTGDIRAIYRGVDLTTDDVIFVDIGSHSELYK